MRKRFEDREQIPCILHARADYYVQLVTFENDDYTSATARAIQEAQKLVEAGFEYVRDFAEAKLFRKRK